MTDFPEWPAFRYGPNGEAQEFATSGEVPAGWKKHPSEFEKAEKPAKEAKAPAAAPAADPAGDTAEVDSSGAAFDPALHAASKSKTQAGLWRMKVGVKRPETAALDL